MSIDNDNKSIDIDLSTLKRKSDHILLEMYHTLNELKNKVGTLHIVITEEKMKQVHSEKELKELKEVIDKIFDKIEKLQVSEARTSVKFGVLTFVATLVFVTTLNVFVDTVKAEDDRDIRALPPPKTEVTTKKRDNEQE